MNESLNERERLILDKLSQLGSISVTDLATELQLSEVTIRSDLKGLEEKGWLQRTRGGAAPAYHRDILERQRLHTEEKQAIARAAAELVQDGDVIMIEAGTTTALIARYLVGKRDVHIVTNSTLVFSYARMNPALQITMTGGEFRRPTESLVGPITLETISRLNVRLAFVGTDGFSLHRGMTTHLVEGGEIVKAMKAHAEQTILVADSSKYGKVGFVSVLPLQEVALIITDRNLSSQAITELQEASISVQVT
ncbi:DeoR/GlpR family DNA-binding transcription regulator [Gracilinema caldarium]|uniref:Transcriptional regulator, DeoR family n=1 Tax=Gracilinema caldarium (strain ATCC 51460 / DSM 7334 / H1) TaxID=744872 RepID=F8EXU5_GRAC1|nr:DeoR/GlpR family DNA-binding transcription regulator [Gracilinema caldarium]AEJ20109.1 transcriptional regulator, DeoR family [Gracilinema caldarium DSM 7334]